MKYKDMPLKFITCNTFIKKMAYNTTKENSANIYVNDIPVEKLVKIESNINYECSKEEMVITSKFN